MRGPILEQKKQWILQHFPHYQITQYQKETIAPANNLSVSKHYRKHGWKTLFPAWDTKCNHHGLLQAGNNLKYTDRFLSTVTKFCKKLSVTLNFIFSGALVYFST